MNQTHLSRVAVYGTLKRGFPNHRLINESTESQFVGSTSLHGYTMISMGNFPAIIKTTGTPYHLHSNPVDLEIYDVNYATLALLDKLESYPGFYDRKREFTSFGTSWVYVLPIEYLYEKQDVVWKGVWQGPTSPTVEVDYFKQGPTYQNKPKIVARPENMVSRNGNLISNLPVTANKVEPTPLFPKLYLEA